MINRYFDSSIHILIDEMNMLMSELKDNERKEFATTKFSEADLAIRLGSPFRQLARYPMQGTKGQDIIIDYKDFEIEIKYWRNWFGGTGTQKAVWKNSYEKAFNWLKDEISDGKKGNRAMICGWFTFFEWCELLQLGKKAGKNPIINPKRLAMLPFLDYKDRVRTVQPCYSVTHREISISENNIQMNWELHGSQSDALNVLMLY